MIEVIAAIVQRDFGPLARENVDKLEAALEKCGVGGCRCESYGWVTLIYRRGRAAADGTGTEQPMEDASRRHALVFDGRLDNRDEVVDGIGSARRIHADTPDGEVVFRSLVDQGTGNLERFIGPWALIFADLENRTLTAARDPIGDRCLCWLATPEVVAIASEPVFLLNLPGVSGDLDERTLAAYFAVWPTPADATFFAAVKQVPAGHRLTVSSGGVESRRYWEPRLEPLRPRAESANVDLFRSTLTTAVEARIRTSDRVAVLMSGGLDSPTVAALAAPVVARGGGGFALPAVSWVFDELREADEREFIEPMLERYGLAPVWVRGDGLWPLRHPDETSFNPSTPLENVYRELHDGAYEATAAAGASVLLSGHSADDLFAGVEGYWLRDLVARGSWTGALDGLRDHWRCARRRHAWTPPLRAAIARLILGPYWSRMRYRRPPDWLTAAARQALPRPGIRPLGRPEQVEALLPATLAPGMRAEAAQAARQGLELRCPFRDRRVIELALRLPADVLVCPGWRKRLMWLAADGLLPEAVRNRRRPSTLAPLFYRGVLSHRRSWVRSLLLERAPRVWRPWLKAAFVDRMLDPNVRRHASGTDWVVLWRCICLARWSLGSEMPR